MSMTGFGRGIVEASFGRVVIEIQSINRRYLEMTCYLPKEWVSFEGVIRRKIGEEVSRGQVSVRLQLIPSATFLRQLLPDPKRLRSLNEEWKAIVEEAGISPKEIDLRFLLESLPQAEKGSFGEEVHPFLEQALGEALEALSKMRREEGAVLCRDIGSRLQEIKQRLLLIEEFSPEATSRMREKLLEKMKIIWPDGTLLDERIAREIALFAEKVDITEELVRLHSHLTQFEGALKEKKAIGRKLDFLIQEMGREINTIGSKCAEAKVAHLVIEMKSDLEKIREQVQNIE